MADWFRKRVVDTIRGGSFPKLRGNVTIGPGLGIGISQTGQEIDVVNEGVLTVTPSGGTAISGDVVLDPGVGIGLSESGSTIDIINTGVLTVGVLGAGASRSGAVKLQAGANVTLTDNPANNSVIIAASGGGAAGVSSLRDGTGSSITGDVPILAGTGIQAAYVLGVNGSVTFSNTGATSVGGLGGTAFTGAVKIEAGTGLAVTSDVGSNAVVVEAAFYAQGGLLHVPAGSGTASLTFPQAFGNSSYGLAALWDKSALGSGLSNEIVVLGRSAGGCSFQFLGGVTAADADLSWIAAGVL